MDKQIVRPHRDLLRRILAAIEDRVSLNRRGSNARQRARLQEANEILGIVRNVIRAYEDPTTPL